MSLPLLIVVASLGIQAVAAVVALGLATRARRVAFLFLALATFLMAVRRAFSLHETFISARPLDAGAETIALAISVLLLAGLLSLRRWSPEDLAPRAWTVPTPALRRLERMALLLGGLAVAAGAIAGYHAYRSSQETALEGAIRSAGALARAVRARAELRALEGDALASVAADLDQLWQQLRIDPESYLCVVSAEGRLALHTSSPLLAGTDVGSSRLPQSGPAGADLTLHDLIVQGRSYEGPYLAPSGESQVAAFAYSAPLRALVAVHLPRSVVDARVRQAAGPWAATLFLAVAAFFPLCFILLDWGYRAAHSAAGEAQAALARSEQSLALALDAGGMGTFDWDVASGAIRWTEGHARLWGLRLENFDGRYETFASRVHREDLPGLEAAVEQARASRTLYHRRYRVLWPDGSLHWLEGKGKFHYDADGQPVRMTGVVTDVGAQVRAERELEVRARQQAAVAALGHVALGGAPAAQLLDQAVALLAATLEVEHALALELSPDGASLAQVAGTPEAGAAAGRLDPTATAESLAAFTLSQAGPVVVPDLRTETRFSDAGLRRRGLRSALSAVVRSQSEQRPFGVLAVLSATQRAFSADDVHFLGALADLLAVALERARSEAAHRAAEELFEAAFQSSPAAMSLSTLAEGRYLSVNDRYLALTGHTREAVVGRTAGEIGWWEDPGQRAALVRALEGAPVRRDMPFRYRDRQGAAHEAVGSFVRVELHGTLCLLSLVEDVTERRQLEAQLAQAQKMEAVGRLAGGVAHDFNNLLNIIIGHGDRMRRELASVPSATHRLEQILKAAERAAALTRQLLAFSRRQVLQPRVLALNDVVEDLTSLVRRLVGQDVELLFVPGARVGHVKIDPSQIEQVVLNLAINARDAMPEGGTLRISTANADLAAAPAGHAQDAPRGAYVVLTVSDSGQGMDEKTRAHAFEPFFTTKPDGTGLGLATTYGIVKQSGGFLRLDSAPGRGTTFEIYLPRVDAPPAGPPEPHTAGAAAERDVRGGETILLVEDEAAARELAEEVLRGYGYVVLPAADGYQALARLAGHEGPVHLLLTDVVMPRLNGPALWERARSARPEMRVLFMSGYTADVVSRHGMSPGQFDLIEKPFQPEALARRVREVLDRSAAGPGAA